MRTIIFDTKNQLGQNFGVLCFWVALSCCTSESDLFYLASSNVVVGPAADIPLLPLLTVPLFTILMRRSEMRAHKEALKSAEQATNMEKEQTV